MCTGNSHNMKITKTMRPHSNIYVTLWTKEKRKGDGVLDFRRESG